MTDSDGIPRLVGFARLVPDLLPDSPVLYVGIPLAEAYAKAQSMLQLLGTLKVPTVLTQKADYELLRKRGVLRPTTAP